MVVKHKMGPKVSKNPMVRLRRLERIYQLDLLRHERNHKAILRRIDADRRYTWFKLAIPRVPGVFRDVKSEEIAIYQDRIPGFCYHSNGDLKIRISMGTVASTEFTHEDVTIPKGKAESHLNYLIKKAPNKDSCTCDIHDILNDPEVHVVLLRALMDDSATASLIGLGQEVDEEENVDDKACLDTKSLKEEGGSSDTLQRNDNIAYAREVIQDMLDEVKAGSTNSSRHTTPVDSQSAPLIINHESSLLQAWSHLAGEEYRPMRPSGLINRPTHHTLLDSPCATAPSTPRSSFICESCGSMSEKECSCVDKSVRNSQKRSEEETNSLKVNHSSSREDSQIISSTSRSSNDVTSSVGVLKKSGSQNPKKPDNTPSLGGGSKKSISPQPRSPSKVRGPQSMFDWNSKHPKSRDSTSSWIEGSDKAVVDWCVKEMKKYGGSVSSEVRQTTKEWREHQIRTSQDMSSSAGYTEKNLGPPKSRGSSSSWGSYSDDQDAHTPGSSEDILGEVLEDSKAGLAKRYPQKTPHGPTTWTANPLKTSKSPGRTVYTSSFSDTMGEDSMKSLFQPRVPNNTIVTSPSTTTSRSWSTASVSHKENFKMSHMLVHLQRELSTRMLQKRVDAFLAKSGPTVQRGV